MLTLPPDFTFLIQLGTFFVLFLVLSRLLFAPFLELLEEREARTSGDVASAAASRAEVQRLLAHLDSELSKARAAANAEVEATRARTREEVAVLYQKAHAEAAARLSELRQQVEAATRDARSTLRDDARTIADAMAAAVLGAGASR